MSIPQLNNPKKLSYNELRTQVSELARRMNILTEMRAVPVEYTAAAKFTFSDSGATLDVPRLDELIEELEAALEALEECETAKEECDTAKVACEETVTGLEGEIADLETALDEACDQVPLAGSWSYGRTVYRVANSGTCSGYAHFQREQYSASLAKNITFQGNTIGNGYRIINNPTLTALYRVHNTYIGSPDYKRVVPVRTDQIRDDGGSNCMSGGGNIVLAKEDPGYPGGYAPQQGGISAGAAGIGTYGVFARTNDTIVGTGVWYPDGPQQVSGSTLIGTITKAGEADVFDYASESSNPCGDQAPPFYTVNYVAGTGGTISGITEQYIEPGGAGVAVTAVADTGFTFVSWSDGSTTAARPADSDPTSNGTLTANFAATP
tara:strand:+ start:42 stop:1181 length:1140 start_codon:yes stop_codon:yes gene_type:complete